MALTGIFVPSSVDSGQDNRPLVHMLVHSWGGAATFAGGWPDYLPAKAFSIFPPKRPFLFASPPPLGFLARGVQGSCVQVEGVR